MRILLTPDIDGWAIGSLSRSIMENMPRFNWIYVPVHPRGLMNSFIPLTDAMEEGIDLWHAMYWHSALNIIEQLPSFKDYPSLLTHHNHHSLEKRDWRVFTALNEMTSWGCDLLSKKHDRVLKIPHGIDLDRYSWIDERPKEKTVGYIGRVVKWKNLADICESAKALGYTVLGSGYVDKPDYWEKCKPYLNDKTLDFFGGIGRTAKAPANVKDDLYRKMRVFVMYSTGEKESGTLPLLEAMARGVPVMATDQGMARDIIEDGKNGVIFTEENFQEKLKMLMEDDEMQNRLRNAAWETIKNYSEQAMARKYAKAYYDIAYNGQPVVSVIIPTYNRMEKLLDTILSIENDPYPAKEIIVADDNSTDLTKDAVQKVKKKIKTPIHYLNTERDGYNLAMARNMAVEEALGDVLLFLDDRLTLKNGLEHIANVPIGEWHHGAKVTKTGVSTKRSFIENFSWIRKVDFVDGGMFNERMTHYGGLSQLTREQYNGTIEFVYDDKASAKENARAVGKRRSEIWKAKNIIDKLHA